MKLILIGLAICIGVLVLLVLVRTKVGRLVQTGLLIAIARPYEQQVADPKGRILIVGDSTAYGTGALLARNSVAGRIGRAYPEYTIENISMNGATIADVTDRFGRVQGMYDLIVLQVGANDILQKQSIRAIEADLRVLVLQAQQHAEHVVLMTAGNIGAAEAFVRDGVPNRTYEELSRAVRARSSMLSNTLGFAYIDLFDEPRDDVFLKEPGTYLAFDDLHPSDAGYGVWFGKLEPVLADMLR